MSPDQTRIRVMMADAVALSLRHVRTGGLPFVGLVLAADGWVSEPGVNRVRETGDPTAHAEIVAMRRAFHVRGASTLEGMTLLATGEPCALCYRFAADHGVEAVHFAVDRDTAARWGFDYRAGYDVDHTQRLRLASTARHTPVEGGLEPFATYLELHRSAWTKNTATLR